MRFLKLGCSLLTVAALVVRSQKIGLTWAIFISFALALTALVTGLFVLVPQQANSVLSDTLADRGKAIAGEIKRKIRIGIPGLGGEASEDINDIVRGEPEIRWVWVLVCDPGQCRFSDVVASKTGVDRSGLEALLREFKEAGSPTRLRLSTGEMLVSDTLKPSANVGNAFVLVGLDRKRVDEAVDSMRRTLIVALIGGMALFLALVFLLSRFLIVRPIKSMRTMASQLAEADLSGQAESASTSELDLLSQALNHIGQGLRETLGRVRGVSESVALVIDQISRSAAASSSGSATVLMRVEETSSSMVEMLASLKGIAENVEVLYQSAEESSSSIMEMAATNDEVAENVTAMAASVEETAGAIEQMTARIKEVAQNLFNLHASTEQTSAAMGVMDISISQVETNAYETARLSEQASKDAESGMERIQRTLQGINKIKESSELASGVIEHLGRRIQEIGNIVDVIDDVAEQTNLLALNAAIIAAQAGEQGKGFAVVADEIKDLAERTATSTKEIGDLIRAVQQESRNAVSAMNQGVRNVDDGVALGREAESALRKLQDSAAKSTQMVKAIARATVEQAKGSKEVTASIQRIVETVQHISKGTQEQARGSEVMMKSADKMKLLTSHAQRSVHEQAHGSKQISKSIENINEMVTHLNRAQKEQTRGSEQVLKAIETIKTVSDSQNRSVKQLEEAIDTLRRQADVLRGEVRRFRV
jgi:methyl-accepting chemotaxis protein